MHLFHVMKGLGRNQQEVLDLFAIFLADDEQSAVIIERSWKAYNDSLANLGESFLERPEQDHPLFSNVSSFMKKDNLSIVMTIIEMSAICIKYKVLDIELPDR